MNLVSACLLGIKCNWRGDDRYKNNAVLKLASSEKSLAVCPESQAGMACPRAQMEITGGDGAAVLDGRAKVVTSTGDDVTEILVAGAIQALKIAQNRGVTRFIGKSNSPSCGCGTIYDGTFSGKLTPGDGVTTALLKRNGIEVISEKDMVI